MNLSRFSKHAFVSSFVLLMLACGGVSHLSAADKADQATRVKIGVKSADDVVSTLDFIIAQLAEKKTSWENDVYPNIEVFLIGVKTDQPVRFDQMFDPELGRVMQLAAPISNLKEFLDDNLDPIGILPKKDAKDKDLYVLSGTVYEGFLRYLPKPVPYAVTYPKKEAIPADMPHPTDIDAALLENSLLFLEVKNTADTTEGRKAAFQKYREAALSELKKASTETNDQFALRQRLRQQSLALFEQWVVESANVVLTTAVNVDKADAPSKLEMSALPGTELEKNIAAVKAEPSHFASVAVPADAVLTLRMNLPIDNARAEGYKEIYALSRPVIQSQIEKDEKLTAEEKAARQKIVTLMLDVMTDSLQSKRADLFVDVFPSGGKHAIVAGIRTPGQEKIEQIIEQLPQANKKWTLTKNAEKEGDVSIHQLKLGGDRPKSLVDFYGPEGIAYLAVTKDAFWVAGGTDGLAVLKSRLSTVGSATPGEADGVVVDLKMHAQPVLRTMKDFMDQADFGVFSSINFMAAREEQEAAKNAEKGKEDSPGRKTASNLANFEWEDTAIAAMEGLDDTFEMSLKLTEENKLSGSSNAHKGLLKALGAVISKFADENLK